MFVRSIDVSFIILLFFFFSFFNSHNFQEANAQEIAPMSSEHSDLFIGTEDDSLTRETEDTSDTKLSNPNKHKKKRATIKSANAFIKDQAYKYFQISNGLPKQLFRVGKVRTKGCVHEYIETLSDFKFGVRLDYARLDSIKMSPYRNGKGAAQLHFLGEVFSTLLVPTGEWKQGKKIRARKSYYRNPTIIRFPNNREIRSKLISVFAFLRARCSAKRTLGK